MKHLLKNQSAKNSIFALLTMVFVVLGCHRLTAFKANLFEGNNAEKVVAQIKKDRQTVQNYGSDGRKKRTSISVASRE